MIIVTGATGALGRLVVDGLLEKLPAEQIIAAVRSPEKAADLAARGVQVREADYNRPETLAAAFTGGDQLLLISGNEIGNRVPQHRAAVEAAKQAGVGFIAYTSVLHADTTPLVVAPEHRDTEKIIRESGLPFTFLRNGWYTENYLDSISQAAQTGTYLGSAGDGRVASATRADYAAAAVAVLTSADRREVYELSGDVAWTYADLAAEIAKASERDVVYQDLTSAEHQAALSGAGLPEPLAGFLVAVDADIKAGHLAATSGELSALIGRPTTPLADTVAATLGN